MEILQRANAELDRLSDAIKRAEANLERARREREEVLAFIKVHQKLSGEPATPFASSPRSDAIGDAVEAFLREQGRRCSIDEIWDHLVKSDVPVPGSNPRKNFATIMSRAKDRFSYKRPNGWWIVGESEPGELHQAPEPREVAPDEGHREPEGEDPAVGFRQNAMRVVS